MTGFIVFFFIFCLVTILLSISYYYRSSLSIRQKIVLSFIRVLIILCILAAFLEPVIKFQRLSPEKPSIPVLIDGSLSMNLFCPESSVIPVAKRLLSINKSHSDASQFDLFLFGDSLRGISSSNSIKFNDLHSNFPDLQSKIFKNAQNMIIISDANWTEYNQHSDDFTERSIYYVNLPASKIKPFIEMTIIDSASDSDSSVFLKISPNGYFRNPDNLKISIFEHNERIFHKSTAIDSGYISSTFWVPINKKNTGKHLYRIVASAEKDSVYCENFFLHFIKPHSFTYSYLNQLTSLDSRFFKIALQKDSDFIENSNISKPSDLYILFKNEVNIAKLPSNKLLLFIGCTPYTNCIKKQTPEDALLVQTENSSIFPIEQFPIKDFPPPASFFVCKNIQNTVIDLLSVVHSKNNKNDTVPILFNGIIEKHEFVALTASGSWQWDFWPLSLNGNDDRPFFFSEQLLTIIKTILFRQAQNSFFFYPVSERQNFDSLVFAFCVPSDLKSYTEAQIKFSIKSAVSSFNFDTICKFNISGSKMSYFKTRRFNPGNYTYNCELVNNRDTFEYSDSINIRQIQSEYHVRSQNKELLEQFAHVVSLDSDSTINQFVDKISISPRVPIEDYFNITRSWLLLSMLLLLFAFEWYLRKKYDLD